jgi:hypothetical protein
MAAGISWMCVTPSWVGIGRQHLLHPQALNTLWLLVEVVAVDITVRAAVQVVI